MKKSTALDHQYTERYVELIREGLNSADAKKQAEKEVYGVQIPEPKLEIDGWLDPI